MKELVELDLLTVEADSMIFENILWKLAEYFRNISEERVEEIDRIFSVFCEYSFLPSKGYSFLLKSVLRFEAWSHQVAFFEWWNMDKFLKEDYQPFQLENGRKIMSLVEQTYIAYSKALLKLGDKEKMQIFLPKIELLTDEYPDMMYPGYFCGKLMLALGTEREEALDTIMPFVRKKQAEFWVWQLLGDLYEEEKDIQLACLLYASHCRTQETFLGKVRMKLVSIYVSREDYPRAKFHLDKLVRCYMQQGWRLPFEVQNWMKEAWVQNVIADKTDGVDYKKYITAILARGANDSIAVVTYVDSVRKRVFLVYGKEKKTCVRFTDLGLWAKIGLLVNLKWISGSDSRLDVVGAEVIKLSDLKDCPYIRFIEGGIERRSGNPFAFVRANGLSCYIRPEEVRRHNLNDGDCISALIVLDYNKKKDVWDWSCVTLKRKKKDGRTDI